MVAWSLNQLGRIGDIQISHGWWHFPGHPLSQDSHSGSSLQVAIDVCLGGVVYPELDVPF